MSPAALCPLESRTAHRAQDSMTTITTPLTSLAIEDPVTAWNDRIRDAGGHLLQSWEWGEFKQGQGWTAERITAESRKVRACAQVLFRAKGPVSVGYIPRGPVIDGDPNAIWPAFLAELDSVARRHRTLTVIIEPDGPLGLCGTFHSAGLVVGPTHVQPGRTVKVPLVDDEALLMQMHQKTRYSVRLAQRRGVLVEQAAPDPCTVGRFHELLSETSERNLFGIHTLAYYADFLAIFGDRAVVLEAWSDGHLAASIIAAAFGDEAIYMYGASSTKYRANGAAFLLQYEAMRWARERGCARYDLWGIPEITPDSIMGEGGKVAGTKGDDWRGLHRFKTGFGGQIVNYPATMERRYHPWLAWAARKTNRLRA